MNLFGILFRRMISASCHPVKIEREDQPKINGLTMGKLYLFAGSQLTCAFDAGVAICWI